MCFQHFVVLRKLTNRNQNFRYIILKTVLEFYKVAAASSPRHSLVYIDGCGYGVWGTWCDQKSVLSHHMDKPQKGPHPRGACWIWIILSVADIVLPIHYKDWSVPRGKFRLRMIESWVGQVVCYQLDFLAWWEALKFIWLRTAEKRGKGGCAKTGLS